MPGNTNKPSAGEQLPQFSVNTPSGEKLSLGGNTNGWQLLIVYRGKHCGRCKPYLNQVESMQKRWNDAGFKVVAVSADTSVKAAADIAEYGWSFEPAVFCLRPDGTVQIAAISNGPSARPDLEALLDGMIFTIENEKPARGMAQP